MGITPRSYLRGVSFLLIKYARIISEETAYKIKYKRICKES